MICDWDNDRKECIHFDSYSFFVDFSEKYLKNDKKYFVDIESNMIDLKVDNTSFAITHYRNIGNDKTETNSMIHSLVSY